MDFWSRNEYENVSRGIICLSLVGEAEAASYECRVSNPPKYLAKQSVNAICLIT